MPAAPGDRWWIRFFTIWTGKQLSIIGSGIGTFALAWWLAETTGSAIVLTSAVMIAFTPSILLGPFVGALIDRWNRHLIIVVSDTFIALLSLWLAYLFWSDLLQIWHVYVFMIGRSFGERMSSQRSPGQPSSGRPRTAFGKRLLSGRQFS